MRALASCLALLLLALPLRAQAQLLAGCTARYVRVNNTPALNGFNFDEVQAYTNQPIQVNVAKSQVRVRSLCVCPCARARPSRRVRARAAALPPHQASLSIIPPRADDECFFDVCTGDDVRPVPGSGWCLAGELRRGDVLQFPGQRRARILDG